MFFSQMVHDLISKLKKFALKKLGKPQLFLGIKVHEQDEGALILTQSKYIKDLLAKINMAYSKGVNTSMFSQCKSIIHGIDVIFYHLL